MKFPFSFGSKKSKHAEEPRMLEPARPNIQSDVARLAMKARQDLERNQRQQEKLKLKGNLQATYEKLKKIDAEQKRKDAARQHVTDLLASAKANEVLETDERFRVLIIQALGKIRREGFEVLKLFAKNGTYDLEDMGDIFKLLEDYTVKRDRFPIIPVTPNPVVDKRIARVYYDLLLELNSGDPVARFDAQQCSADPDCIWNNVREIRERSQFKNGMCMRRNYIRPVGRLTPITIDDVWEVIDSRPFLRA